jgi:hypothetical protein
MIAVDPISKDVNNFSYTKNTVSFTGGRIAGQWAKILAIGY